jgi:hypothetical protein
MNMENDSPDIPGQRTNKESDMSIKPRIAAILGHETLSAGHTLVCSRCCRM